MAQQIIREDFSSWDRFVETAADRSRRQWRRREGSRDETGRFDRGTATFAEAVDLARHGWPQGRQLISDALAIVFPERAQLPERVHDVAGAYPDVPRAVAGDPMSMINLRPSSRAARPVVRVDYSRSAPSIVPAAAIINRGAALLGAVDALESAGYSVELRLVFKNTSLAAPLAFHSAVTIKDAGAPLDIDRAAFALINPAVLRRLAFAIREQHGELERNGGFNSYGVADSTPLDSERDTVFVPRACEADLRPAAARLAVEIAFADFREALQ
jgi:hypothetical protein